MISVTVLIIALFFMSESTVSDGYSSAESQSRVIQGVFIPSFCVYL